MSTDFTKFVNKCSSDFFENKLFGEQIFEYLEDI